jgi:ABC-type sulfate transport system permease subunit
MAQAVINYSALSAGGRTATGGGWAVRIALTVVAVAFLTLFVVVPAYNVFHQAFSKGWHAYVNTFFPPDPADVKKLPAKERREVTKKLAQAEKNWSAIRMTLAVTAVAVPINALFGVAAAWAITKFRFKGRSLLVSLIDLPFSVSPVVSGLVFVLLMGRQGFLQVGSGSTRATWLSPAIRALPAALVTCLGVALLTFVVTAVAREVMTPSPLSRRTQRKIRRVGGYAILAVPVLLVVAAYLRAPQYDWQWLAPSGWRWPALGSLYWRGFGEGHAWPIGAREWMAGVIFTPLATLLASLFVTFPFVARALIPLMESQGSDAEQAAASLGASGFTTFWRVTLPAIKWGLIYGVILCTARSLGEFGAVSVVSGHLDANDTMPLRVEKLWNEYNTQAAFTVASLLALLAVVTLIIKTIAEWKAARDLRDVDVVSSQ